MLLRFRDLGDKSKAEPRSDSVAAGSLPHSSGSADVVWARRKKHLKASGVVLGFTVKWWGSG